MGELPEHPTADFDESVHQPNRLAILVVLLAVVSSNRDVGLAAALTYGIAYTAELGLNLLGYYGQEPSL